MTVSTLAMPALSQALLGLFATGLCVLQSAAATGTGWRPIRVQTVGLFAPEELHWSQIDNLITFLPRLLEEQVEVRSQVMLPLDELCVLRESSCVASWRLVSQHLKHYRLTWHLATLEFRLYQRIRCPF